LLQGFYGDGYACHDIDECSFDSSAREQLGGCSSGSTCINEPGSFRCECLPNHQRIDSRNCVELLRV
ncbi:calcium binding EGF domain protein, partial [Ancylostoma caninum]